jgi:hypothetical protein
MPRHRLRSSVGKRSSEWAWEGPAKSSLAQMPVASTASEVSEASVDSLSYTCPFSLISSLLVIDHLSLPSIPSRCLPAAIRFTRLPSSA